MWPIRFIFSSFNKLSKSEITTFLMSVSLKIYKFNILLIEKLKLTNEYVFSCSVEVEAKLCAYLLD